MATLKDIVKDRRSVRTFDGNLVSPEDREKLGEYINAGITNPFGIPAEFVLLAAEEYGLSSPVIAGEKLYVAGKVAKVPYADVAFGYSFERLVLFAWSLGIGTTWIGGTMKRELMPAEKFCFDGSFDKPLSGIKQQDIADLIEMVRWAPSAVNKQPWRIVRETDSLYHFYEKKDKGYVSDSTGDLQKIDVGIALCHFVMGLEEKGKKAAVEVNDPVISIPGGVEYIASVQIW